jgi:steroid 5-alpha reductase family enzyme
MNTLDLLLYGQLGASIVMVIGWLIALLIRNTSYVDVLWAYGVGVLGLCYLVIQSDLCHPARL